MWVTVNKKNATEIQDSVVKQILSLYPEEGLSERPIFIEAFATGKITLKNLKKESQYILIPWQMFLLNQKNLDTEIKTIELKRKYKFSEKLLSKRKGTGNITSKRVIDRLIRLQNFIVDYEDLPSNDFLGSLKGKSIKAAAKHILNYFDINQEKFWDYKKSSYALDKIIGKIENKNINVSRGVATNGLLPSHHIVGKLYKNTSGFVIKDDKIPFIFLPSEINPDEVDSRQIYSLVYFLVCIGLNEFSHILGKNFKSKLLSRTYSRLEMRLHAITSELLIPSDEISKYTNQKITISVRDTLCRKLKVTPTALITTLKIRNVITEPEYKELEPPPYEPSNKALPFNQAAVSSSIKKFCGAPTYTSLCSAIKSGRLKSKQAQYLIFGLVNKNKFRTFRSEADI